ncbi:methyl-accepting chemotaxis protein [Archangium lansingense]|uniref:Methyl-accepting chemotaxis protein n=1 Tax=Archangium lansingense TaxID=2995310 RepID=A0ABT4AF02_9BACT|nr:methyl-accepting chemotaxis protein [Archangium lansinium]MCY1080267.1 methyl-accepting chemotaxis protein [Archangium lansinium]
MSAPEGLKGLAEWTTRPSWLGGTVGLGLALFYGRLTQSVPEGHVGLFLGLLLAVLAMNAVLSGAQERHALRVLRAMAQGRLPPNPDNLRRALQEVRRIPGRCFWFTLQGWLGGALMLAATFPPLADAQWSMGMRIGMVGLSLGPLSAMLVYLLVVRRGRLAAERIAAQGLSPQEVIAALPAERLRLRRRLVMFTAVAVLSPSVFILDVSVSRTLKTFDEIQDARGDSARQQKVVHKARQATGVQLGLLAGLVVVLVVGTAYVAGTVLAEPLRALSEDATRIAQGEVRTPRFIPAEDEVWAVSGAFTRMQAQLAQALVQLQRAGLQISSTTEQLVATSADQETGAGEQAISLNETRATTEELARSAQQIAVNAESVSAMAETTFGAAQSGQRSAAAFLAAMHRMKGDNQAIADAVVRLNKRVQQIGKVVEFINEIADKSDLLALNAELEGTKAGEPGRGFSLVAAEMRRLAENVLSSTLAIERLIDEIRDATQAAVMATEAGLKTTERGAALAAQVDQSLGLILELARQTSHAVRSISLATQQQQTGTDQLAAAMGDILRVTEENAEATQQMVAANTDLSALARDLKATVQRFRVAEREG